jgi:hypothetical protein
MRASWRLDVRRCALVCHAARRAKRGVVQAVVENNVADRLRIKKQ